MSTRPDRVFHEPAKGGGRSPALLFQPVPMARKQGNFAAGDAQARPARGLRRELGIRPFDDLGKRAAQVEVNLPPAVFVEDQDARFRHAERRRRP